jgi:hypothetical protein
VDELAWERRKRLVPGVLTTSTAACASR